MANKYPYPEAEHYTFPGTAAELIQDELRLYPDGPSFRTNIVGLSRMYETTPLLTSCRKYATYMQLAAYSCDQAGVASQLDNDFYAGEVYAIHAMGSLLPTDTKRYLLRYNAFEKYEMSDPASSERGALIKGLIEQLAEYRKETWKLVRDTQAIYIQERLADIAILAYSDIPNAGEREDGFMAGYLFSGKIIAHIFASDE